MSVRAASSSLPRALVWATEIDVLPLDRVVQRRDGYLVVRSPSNPTHYWGNLLLFDDRPGAGDGDRWEERFEAEFARDPQVRHRTFAWDRIDGAPGCAHAEFVARGYEVEQMVGLVGNPVGVRPHPRENREVLVRALNPVAGFDDGFWEQVVELQVAGRGPGFHEHPYRDFTRRRLADLQALFRVGRGAWYVALGERDVVVGSCGVVVTGSRGRFQAVDTALAYRRMGICSRLVVAAAHITAERYGARSLVIAADPGYHALGLYESLGFQPRERVCGVCRHPPPVNQ